MKNKYKSNLLKQVGLNIRRVRDEKGVTQEALSFEADLDRSYIGGVERGERNIAIINLKKIADALKVSLSELLKDL